MDCSPSITDWISATGEVIGALGTVMAVWVAAQWRRQARLAKRAEAAAEAIASGVAALDALRFTSSARLPDQPGEVSDREWLAQVYAARWEAVYDVFRRLHAAHRVVIVQLGKGMGDVVGEVEALQRHIHANQMTWLNPGVFGTPAAGPHFKDAVGSDVKKKIDALEQKVIDTLGPMARLE